MRDERKGIQSFLPLPYMWQRYYFRDAVKTALFFFASFAALYVLIDYSSHAKLFHGAEVSLGWSGFILYYTGQLAIILPLLLPFAVAVATLKVLLGAVSRYEAVALMAAGVPRRRLQAPLIWLCLAGAALLYIDEQFVIPPAARYIKHIEDSHAAERRKGQYKEGVDNLPLGDGSTVLFRGYDASRGILLKALWLRTIDDIWWVDSFPLGGGTIEVDKSGEGRVRHFLRDSNGALTAADSIEQAVIAPVRWDDPQVWVALTDPSDLSLSELWRRQPSEPLKSDKETAIVTAFYYKIILPWISLFAALLLAPSCFIFSRGFRSFALYSFALFGVVVIIVCFDTTMLLAKRQLLSPMAAMGMPALLLSLAALWRQIFIRSDS